jgi:hypothetical protein
MLRCMRTTIRLDDDVLARAKETAARTGRTLTAVIEDALRETFARTAEGEGARPQLPTFGGRGLQAGVDLDDTAALLDLMESAER